MRMIKMIKDLSQLKRVVGVSCRILQLIPPPVSSAFATSCLIIRGLVRGLLIPNELGARSWNMMTPTPVSSAFATPPVISAFATSAFATSVFLHFD